MTTPKLSIIILSYNRIEEMRACLASIRRLRYPNLETVVVDNGSVTEAPDMIAREFPEVRLYRASRNHGICAGRNAAALMSTGDMLWFMDNDAEIIDPDAATRLVAIMQADPELGAVGGEAVVDDTGRPIGTKTLTLLLNGMVRGSYLMELAPYELHPANMLEGCNLMVRRETFMALKGFDEGCVFHWDDTDFVYRLNQTGLKAAVVGHVPVVHHFAGHSRRVRPLLTGRSRMYFALKNFPLWRIAVLPLADIAFTLDPMNLVRLFSKAQRLSFGDKHNVVALEQGGASAPGRWSAAWQVVGVYLLNLLAGYLYLVPVARRAWAARRRSPDSLASADLDDLSSERDPGRHGMVSSAARA